MNFSLNTLWQLVRTEDADARSVFRRCADKVGRDESLTKKELQTAVTAARISMVQAMQICTLSYKRHEALKQLREAEAMKPEIDKAVAESLAAVNAVTALDEEYQRRRQEAMRAMEDASWKRGTLERKRKSLLDNSREFLKATADPAIAAEVESLSRKIEGLNRQFNDIGHRMADLLADAQFKHRQSFDRTSPFVEPQELTDCREQQAKLREHISAAEAQRAEVAARVYDPTAYAIEWPEVVPEGGWTDDHAKPVLTPAE